FIHFTASAPESLWSSFVWPPPSEYLTSRSISQQSHWGCCRATGIIGGGLFRPNTPTFEYFYRLLFPSPSGGIFWWGTLLTTFGGCGHDILSCVSRVLDSVCRVLPDISDFQLRTFHLSSVASRNRLVGATRKGGPGHVLVRLDDNRCHRRARGSRSRHVFSQPPGTLDSTGNYVRFRLCRALHYRKCRRAVYLRSSELRA